MNRRSFLAPLMAVAMVTAPMLMIPAPAAAAPPAGTGLVTSIFQTIPGVGTFAGTLTTTSFFVGKRRHQRRRDPHGYVHSGRRRDPSDGY